MDHVAVIVATFGADEWRRRGEETAAAVVNPFGPVIARHDVDLARARNIGAELAESEWLCFLDADDHLGAGYLAALLAAPYGDLRAPSVAWVGPDGTSSAPQLLNDRPGLATMNECVIGTLVRRSMFLDAGGFWTEPLWEDWSLFRRCWLLGARVVHVAGAVYHARQQRPGEGRNNRRDVNRERLLWEIIDSTDAWHARRSSAA